MTVTKSQLLSTGAALRWAEKQGVARDDVVKVTLDDVEVDAGAARKALADAEKAVADAATKRAERERRAQENPGWWRKTKNAIGAASHTVMHQAKKAAAPTMRFIEKHAPVVNRVGAYVGEATKDAVASTPEDVAKDAKVVITLKSGAPLEVPVVVYNELATALLKATSIAAGGASQWPVFGNLVQGGTGLICAVVSGAGYVFKNESMQETFGGMAKKHVVLGLVGFLPGAGHVASGAQVANDAARFTEGVPLDELVQKPIEG